MEVRPKLGRIQAAFGNHARFDQFRVHGLGQGRGIGRGLGNGLALERGRQFLAQTVAAFDQDDR